MPKNFDHLTQKSQLNQNWLPESTLKEEHIWRFFAAPKYDDEYKILYIA